MKVVKYPNDILALFHRGQDLVLSLPTKHCCLGVTKNFQGYFPVFIVLINSFGNNTKNTSSNFIDNSISLANNFTCDNLVIALLIS